MSRASARGWYGSLAVSAMVTRVLSPQSEPTFARLQPGNTIEILDLERAGWRPVYQSQHWSSSSLSVSPDGKLLAFLAWSEGVVIGHDYAWPPTSRLLVLDRNGRLHSTGVADVQRYAWCGPSCVVYITGQYEESHVGFRPDAVEMLDLRTGRRTPMPAPANPIGITWTPFDSGVYLKNRARTGEAVVYRLDLTTRRLEPTRLKDHLLSPTGRYYTYRPESSDTLVVYDARSNRPIDLSRLRHAAIPLGWISNREDLLLAVERPGTRGSSEGLRPPRPKDRTSDQPAVATYRIYDVPAARVRERLRGVLGPWQGPGHLRLLRRGRAYHVLGQ